MAKKIEADLQTTQYPAHLDTPEFREVWAEFHANRRENGHPLTPSAERRILKKLSRYDVRSAVAMVDQSVQREWRGVFEVHDNQSFNNREVFTHDTVRRLASQARPH